MRGPKVNSPPSKVEKMCIEKNGLVTIPVAAAGDGHLESFVWHIAAAVVVVAAAVAAAASVACKFVVGLTLVGVEGVETVVC